ncbi:MAG TPA: hypothetical protein VGM94_04385 [Galbitalea sp.]|jgi:hypothetical protein
MSGLAVSAIAGNLLSAALGGILGRGWRRLARRMNIARYVRNHVDFAFPQPSYRAWLNGQTPATMSRPLEDAARDFSVDLDLVLGRNASWRRNPARHSEALRLVEETYAAFIHEMEPADAAVLSEQWATARHEVIVELLASNTDSPKLTNKDRAIWLLSLSDARRRVRLQSMGLGTTSSEALFAGLAAHLPNTHPGSMTALIGPFGSGKSELAEEWTRKAIARYESGDSLGQPIWLWAADLSREPLVAALERSLSSSELRSHGASVVIDGLDETSYLIASRIVEQSRVLCESNSNLEILITCRPGVLPMSSDHVMFDGLGQAEAVALIEMVSGAPATTWGWDPVVVDAIRRPFFAIAVGLSIARGERPRGQAELISSLVERALARPTAANTSVQTASHFDVLIRLARNVTESGNAGDGLTFEERERARSSTLVYQHPDGRLEFSLPIFQQWFAAKAIINDIQDVDRIAGSAESFDKWRWALAIAGIAATSVQLDELLERSIRANAGAGSWLLGRISEWHSWFRDPNSAALDGAAAARRLGLTYRTWLDGIGALGPRFYPVPVGGHFTLGVRVDHNRVSTGWKLPNPPADEVVELPLDVHPLNQQNPSDPSWRPDRSGSIAEGEEWPWRMSRDPVQSHMLKILNEDPLLGPRGGIWHLESVYGAARALVSTSGLVFAPIPKSDVLAAAQPLLAALGDSTATTFQVGRRRIRGDMLLDLVQWAEGPGSGFILRPLPVPDVSPEAAGGWTWGLYSDIAMQRFYAEAFGLASVAYDEAVGTVFANLGWTMGHAADGSIRVIADLSFEDSDVMGPHMPGIAHSNVSQEVFEQAIAAHPDAFISANRRALVTLSPSRRPSWLDDFAIERMEPRIAPFSSRGIRTQSVADDAQKERPASQMAAHWLWSDLKKIELGEGTFPQLTP